MARRKRAVAAERLPSRGERQENAAGLPCRSIGARVQTCMLLMAELKAGCPQG
jgi:hypothetical protein